MSHRDAEMDWTELQAARETIDRLRAELAARGVVSDALSKALGEREAAIARVRELFAGPWVGYDTAQAFAADVLRVLEPTDGGTE